MPWAYTGTKKKFDRPIYGGIGGRLIFGMLNGCLWGVYSQVVYIWGAY